MTWKKVSVGIFGKKGRKKLSEEVENVLVVPPNFFSLSNQLTRQSRVFSGRENWANSIYSFSLVAGPFLTCHFVWGLKRRKRWGRRKRRGKSEQFYFTFPLAICCRHTHIQLVSLSVLSLSYWTIFVNLLCVICAAFILEIIILVQMLAVVVVVEMIASAPRLFTFFLLNGDTFYWGVACTKERESKKYLCKKFVRVNFFLGDKIFLWEIKKT